MFQYIFCLLSTFISIFVSLWIYCLVLTTTTANRRRILWKLYTCRSSGGASTPQYMKEPQLHAMLWTRQCPELLQKPASTRKYFWHMLTPAMCSLESRIWCITVYSPYWWINSTRCHHVEWLFILNGHTLRVPDACQCLWCFRHTAVHGILNRVIGRVASP